MRSTVARFFTLIWLLAVAEALRTWTCEDKKCVKNRTDNNAEVVAVRVCKITCLEFGGLWPRPTGTVNIGKSTNIFDVGAITFSGDELPTETAELVKGAKENFVNRIKGSEEAVKREGDEVFKVDVKIGIYDPHVNWFASDTDESYKLTVKISSEGSNRVQATVDAQTFFGLRHGLETLSQLCVYDDLNENFRIINEAAIEDAPVFQHRGISLDTARSYISINRIRTTIDTMAANKLNTFHWHITDSHSFPYVSKAYPELSVEGAYSKHHVYTQADIEAIVAYARVRGVRVIPEFDAPAHVGEGWRAIGEDLITCFKWEPWGKYCVEPPCGQFDPTNEKVYEVLGTIYQEYVEMFHSDLFHMGGDEVNLNCWNSTTRIVEWMTANNYSLDSKGFHDLWHYYQEKMLKKLRATKTDPSPQAILWTNSLTELQNIDHYLKPQDYIIQIWTTADDQVIKALLDKDFRIIFSNYDELYFDCGGSAWIGGPGDNWCAPYKGWQKVYGHSPYDILRRLGVDLTDAKKKLILGSESALWTEEVDDSTVDNRLWPRAAALAERLWSDPQEDWSAAQYRMNYHRERLVRGNANAELLQPAWCYQNDGYCGLGV